MSVDLVSSPKGPSFVSNDEAIDRFVKYIGDGGESGGRRFKSGFIAHDQSAGYFQRGGLYLFAARPGVGKTSYLLSLACQQVKQGVAVYYLNLEMTVEAMMCRLYCLAHPGTNLLRIIQRELTQAERDTIIASSQYFKTLAPLWHEDTDFTTFANLVKQQIAPSSDSILLIDYLGLFSMRGIGPGENFALISEIAKQLKNLARRIDIPVISAVQLNREIEKRKPGSTLNLADLRGSGELENHADAVFGLSRDSADRMEVQILKNRNGPLGSYDLSFDAPRAAVEGWE